MEAHPDGCQFTCRYKPHLTVHRKAIHGPFPEGSKTAKAQTKKLQEKRTKDIEPGVGAGSAAQSGTLSAPSSKASVEVNAPLPKLTIKFKIPRNTKA